jgi:ring-1,2-phenylacetyl-CoA epoxidase subunit PaaC
MAENQNNSLIELAETIADNKFILGDRLVEVGISGPDLESTLASIAMAQAELGHARLVYRWAGELSGTKVDVKQQTGKALKSLVEIDNWISLIAGSYVANVAIDLIIKAVIEADSPKVHPPFSKMLKEQHEHLVYLRSWCEQLLNDKGSIPRRIRTQIEKVTIEAEKWIQKVENDSLLISEKIIFSNGSISKQFNVTIGQLRTNGVVTNA